MSSSSQLRSLSIDNINPHVKTAKYAVRGELAVRAEKYRVQCASKDQRPSTPDTPTHSQGDLPFDSVVSANIGNPQQLDQKPLTFFRQVCSLVENPDLLEKEQVLIEHLGYQPDVIDRARALLKELKSVGAYSVSQGVPIIREDVAKFIERRDGFPSDPSQIYLTAGASAGVNTLLTVICSSEKTGVLVPIPQYPLYTAALALLNAQVAPYQLDESKGWGTDLDTIKTSLAEARKKGVDVRAIVVINPGNPTGANLSGDEVKAILKFAAQEKLVVMADEVYQTNIFEGDFYSFKKGLRELQHSDENKDGAFDTVELASLHSVSKGMVGECGQRGGYMELVGFDEEVVGQIYKLVSIGLCPPVVGQCIVDCMVNPPKEGEPSYAQYKKEYDGISDDLRNRAMALYDAFKEMEGVKCQQPQGSMYLFPTIELPQKARDAADKDKKQPDEYYVSRLLDATGVCMVPGSGFGQKEGTFHFRTTFLAPGTEWVGRITKFHAGFMDEFR